MSVSQRKPDHPTVDQTIDQFVRSAPPLNPAQSRLLGSLLASPATGGRRG